MEKIRCAAVRDALQGHIHEGVNHEEAIKKVPSGICISDCGFMTTENRFVNRKEANAIAFAAGQIENGAPERVLFSEDLNGYPYETEADKQARQMQAYGRVL